MGHQENAHHKLDMKVAAVGVGVMIVRDGKVLLQQRAGSHGAGSYAWCGGGLEFGESFEDAARRETLQETGMQVTSLRFLCLSNIREYGRHYVDIEFLAEATGEPKHLEPDAGGEWIWYPLDALPGPLFAPVARAVESYHRYISYHP